MASRAPAATAKLRHVALVFRHGDRAPALPGASGSTEAEAEEEAWRGTLPSAELTEALDSHFPVRSQATSAPHGMSAQPFEMLTRQGGMQTLQLGRSLRGAYGPLQPGSIEVMASNFRRTQQSAQYFLAGLLAPEAAAGTCLSAEKLQAAASLDVTTLVMEECKVDSFSRNSAEIVERLRGIEERCDFAGREVGDLAETRAKLESLSLFSAPAGAMHGKFSWLHGYDVLTCYAAHPELTPPTSVPCSKLDRCFGDRIPH
eukprot:s3706_g4.t1